MHSADSWTFRYSLSVLRCSLVYCYPCIGEKNVPAESTSSAALFLLCLSAASPASARGTGSPPSPWQNTWPQSSARRRTKSTAPSTTKSGLADTEKDAPGFTTSPLSARPSCFRTFTLIPRTRPNPQMDRTWPTSRTKKCRYVYSLCRT